MAHKMNRSRAALTAAAATVAASLLPAASASAATIASVYSGGAGTYTLTGTVTSILNTNATSGTNTFILADGTGSVLAYNINGSSGSTGFTPVSGENVTLTGVTNSPYQGAPELINTGLTSSSITVNSTGNAVSATPLTVAQFDTSGNGTSGLPPYSEALVTLSNVTLPAGTTTLATNTAYTLTDATGTTTFYGYKSDSAVLAAVNNADAAQTASGNTLFAGPVNITGYADEFNGVPEIYPLSITSAAATVPEPATAGLVGTGIVALLAHRRRRRA